MLAYVLGVAFLIFAFNFEDVSSHFCFTTDLSATRTFNMPSLLLVSLSFVKNNYIILPLSLPQQIVHNPCSLARRFFQVEPFKFSLQIQTEERHQFYLEDIVHAFFHNYVGSRNLLTKMVRNKRRTSRNLKSS